AEHPYDRTEHRDGESQGVLRHRVQTREVTFAHLLLAAGFIELDQLEPVGVVEIGHRRIVERKMPVLPDAQTAEIDGLGSQQTRVAFAFRERQEGIAFEVMELLRAQPSLDALPQVTAKTG